MNQRLLQSVETGRGVCDGRAGRFRSVCPGSVHAVRPGGGDGGFTIVELLVVSAIIALLAGAIFHVSAKRYQRVLVEKCAKDIYLVARYARIFAIEKQRSCKLVFDQAQKRFYLYGSVGSGDEPGVISSVYARPGRLPDKINFESIVITPTGGEYGDDSGGNPVVVFRSDGTADAAVLVIGDGQHHYSVSIAAGTGRAKVRRGNADDEGENYQPDVIDLDVYQ